MLNREGVLCVGVKSFFAGDVFVADLLSPLSQQAMLHDAAECWRHGKFLFE